MGTILSYAAAITAAMVVVAPFGWHFALLALALVLFWAAAFARPAAASFLAAALLVAALPLAMAPFSAPGATLNELRRAAETGDAAALALSGFYQALEGWALPLKLGIALLVLSAVVLGARRAAEGAHPFLLDASEGLARFAIRIGKLGSLLFLPMILVIFYDVSQRKLLDFYPGFADSTLSNFVPSTKLQELEWHLHAVLFLLCLGFGYVRDAHVRIELVRDALRPRTRVWIELVGCCVFLVPYCFVILVYGYDFSLKSFLMNEVSAARTGLPYRFAIKAFLPIGFTLLGLAGLSVALRCVVYLFGPDRLQGPAGYYAGTHHALTPGDPLAEART